MDDCHGEARDRGGDDMVVTLADAERLGTACMSSMARGYYQSGADEQQTLGENTRAYRRLRLLPRMLRDVSRRDLSVTLLGGRERLSFPVGIAPSAMQKMAHPDGEAATARAARDAGTLMIVSTIATTSLEEVRDAAPDGRRWFQLYVYRDRGVTRSLVRRAEEAGYSALVLTVDTPYFGQRLADVRNKLALPPALKMANFNEADFQNVVSAPDGGSGLSTYASALFDPSLTWTDVDWLRSITHLPLVIKGILRGDDAVEAVNHGAAAILVSNHGARQMDGEPSTIECLPEVVRSVAGRCEVYLDGGVRCGTDVAKALCLGARAVFIGRPVLWGLAYKGKEGVDQVLAILRSELDRAMGLLGWNFQQTCLDDKCSLKSRKGK
ncbi:2-Hydroxyacid oxidase 1-like isoform X1 [Dermacentor andersoni]|uniref:2-Hydroxyacid oxidase 1-like isoform X1 n=1 Tax=Dermacentor andersoni TaxID=34620 RepID=UPI002416BE05|nr:2-Hydroxyacid oxidase 1-like isoform X2 [Dermacentor andersoni]